MLFLYLINAFVFIFSNETNEYVPKRKRVKVYQSLKRKLNQWINKIEKKIDHIQIQLTSPHKNKKSNEKMQVQVETICTNYVIWCNGIGGEVDEKVKCSQI